MVSEQDDRDCYFTPLKVIAVMERPTCYLPCSEDEVSKHRAISFMDEKSWGNWYVPAVSVRTWFRALPEHCRGTDVIIT